MIQQLEALLNGPRDGALLRFSLGNEYLKAGHALRASELFRDAIERDRLFSAAWKGLGKSLAEAGDIEAALAAYATGIQVATERGDLQVAKEMTVFAKRLQKIQQTKEATP